VLPYPRGSAVYDTTCTCIAVVTSRHFANVACHNNENQLNNDLYTVSQKTVPMLFF